MKIISKCVAGIVFVGAAAVIALFAKDPFLSNLITLFLAFFSASVSRKGKALFTNERFLVAAVLISFFLNIVFITGLVYTWKRVYISVPDITGLSVKEAVDTLNSCGLSFGEAEENDEIVTSQNPRAGVKVAPKTEVELFVEEKESKEANVGGIQTYTEALRQDILDKRPGETFLYGRYEQDEGKEGAEPIEWIVLAKEEDRMLVISKLGLDARPYNMSGDSSTWESSSIRAWLKDEFYSYAFSEEEKARILLTENYADDDTDAPRKQGKDTSDYVFLLSITEANQHIKNNVSLAENDDCCKPSRYVYDKVEIITNNSCWWWLRTSAEQGTSACSINSDGTVNYGTRGVSWKQGAVRPAMWISLK